MQAQIFFCSYGVIEDNNQVYANAQMLTDFTDEDGRVGCQVGKVSIDTDNNNAVAKRLAGELQRAKGAVFVELIVGSKAKGGNVVSVVKDFKLINQQAKTVG